MIVDNLESLRKIRDAPSHSESRQEINEAIDLYEAYLNSDGYRIYLLYSDLQRSHYIVEENYDDLIQTIEVYEDGSIEVSKETYEEIEQLTLEFNRCLQNYVAATKSRYELTQDVIDELTDIDSKEPSIREQYEEQKNGLDIVKYGSFFTGLRNYCLHDRPPIVKVSQKISRTHNTEGITSSEERQFKLRKSDLLESGDYLNSTARDFLNEQGDEFHVHPVAEKFQKRLDKLYEWLDNEIETRFADSFEENRELKEQALEKQREIFEG